MPVTVIAGPDQTRSPRPPVPMSGSPGTTSASSRNSSSLYDAPVHSSRRRPGDGDVAVLVVQRGERAQQRDQRVGRGAAELAAVLRPGERRHLDVDHRHAAQRDRQRRHARADAAHVADQHRVGGEQLGLRRRDTCVSALPTSSWPSITILIPTGGWPSHARSAPTCMMMFDFESARAAAVDRAVALGRLERRRLPLRLVARPARRRSGCTAARSARPPARGSRRVTTGAVSGSSSGVELLRRRRRAAARRPARTPRAAARASARGYPGAEMDGIATSARGPPPAAASARQRARPATLPSLKRLRASSSSRRSPPDPRRSGHFAAPFAAWPNGVERLAPPLAARIVQIG